MELAKFIEQDIAEFLNNKSEERREELSQVRAEESSLFSIERDYAEETKEALNKNNLGEAKRIFDDLRDYYNGLSKTSDEREKIYAIMQEVFTMIKAHFAKERGETLEDEIKEVEQHGFGDAPSPQPDHGEVTYDANIMKERAAFAKAALMAQQERENKDKELTKLVNKITTLIEKEQLVESVKEYRKLKEEFSQYPSDDKFRKVEWYNQVLSLYEQIRQLQQRLRRKEVESKTASDDRKEEEEERHHMLTEVAHSQPTKSQGPAARAPIEQTNTAPAPSPPAEDQGGLLRAKNTIKQAIDQLNQGDIHATENTIISAKHAVAKLPDGEAKRKFEHIISQINSKVQFAKHNTGKDEIEAVYEQAVQAQNAGQKDIAASLYERVLKANPNHLQAKVRLQQLRG